MKIRRLDIEGYRSLRQVSWSPGDLTVVTGGGAGELARAVALLSCATRGWHTFAEALAEEGDFGDDPAPETRWRLVCTPESDEEIDFVYELVAEGLGDTGPWEVTFERVTREDDFNEQELLARQGGRVGFVLSPRDPRGFRPPPAASTTAALRREVAGVAGDMTALGALPKVRGDRRMGPAIDVIAAWARYADLSAPGAPAGEATAEAVFHGVLAENGRNLIQVLYNLYDRAGSRESLDLALAAALPGYAGLEFPVVGAERIGLVVRGVDGAATSVADLPPEALCTLRVVAALAAPEPPSLLWLDEPEALPSTALPVVAALAITAAERTQVVIAPRSVVLRELLEAHQGVVVTHLGLVDRDPVDRDPVDRDPVG